MYHSKRAKILSEVLEYINSDDWDYREGFIVFGNEAFLLWCQSPRTSGEEPSDRALRKFVHKAKVSRGASSVAKKIKLEALPPNSVAADFLEVLKTLPQADAQHLLEELSRTKSAESLSEAQVQSRPDLEHFSC